MPLRALARRFERWALRLRWVKSIRQSLRIRRVHGTFSPDSLRLPGAVSPLFVNPRDNRARSLLGDLGRKQASLRELWQRAATVIEPTIVIDVGVNYGEFLFTASYPRTARIIGIEANPRLADWNQRSLAAHPNGRQIELIYALASDQRADEQTLYVDPAWSGRSSGLEVRRGLVPVRVPSVTLDSLFEPEQLIGQTVLFKIDVEGFEPKVLRGMHTILRTCRQAVGIVELNGRSLASLGLTLDHYVDELSRSFQVYSLGVPGAVPELHEIGRRIVPDGKDPAEIETNLLLVSDPSLLGPLSLTVHEFAPGALAAKR
jgi:FkbM family methyltransferase